jgi:hypothetical protein
MYTDLLSDAGVGMERLCDVICVIQFHINFDYLMSLSGFEGTMICCINLQPLVTTIQDKRNRVGVFSSSTHKSSVLYSQKYGNQPKNEPEAIIMLSTSVDDRYGAIFLTCLCRESH